MARAYFDDDEFDLDLGYHGFGLPAAQRANLRVEPPDAPSALFDSGGGLHTITVTGQRIRDNIGDAERWIYEVLRRLACSGPGVLAYEDNLGNSATFDDAVCVGALGRVFAYQMADVRYTFVAPSQSGQPPWGGAPAAWGAYAGTTSARDYQAGGVDIGQHPVGMEIEMTRGYQVVSIPRARGGRARGAMRGAHLRFRVTSHCLTTAQNLAAYLHNLESSIGPRAVDLTGNGNTYADVVLDSLRPRQTDRPSTQFVAEFLRPVEDLRSTTTAAPYPTTTTEAPPTTTTAAATTTAAPAAANCAVLDSGALQSGGPTPNCAPLDSGALQES